MVFLCENKAYDSKKGDTPAKWVIRWFLGIFAVFIDVFMNERSGIYECPLQEIYF